MGTTRIGPSGHGVEVCADDTTLDALVEHRLTQEAVLGVARHLLSCIRCWMRLVRRSPRTARLCQRLFGRRSRPAPLATEAGTSPYHHVFARLSHLVASEGESIHREQRLTAELYRELMSLPPEVRRSRLWEDARFHSLGLAERLLRASRDRLGTETTLARDLADLALEVLDSLDERRFGPALLNDYRARAWACRAAAVQSQDPPAARDAFAAAEAYLARGTGDPVGRGELMGLGSALLLTHGRYGAALRLARRAGTAFHKARDPHLQGCALLRRAQVHERVGEPEKSLTLRRQAAGMIDLHREPAFPLELSGLDLDLTCRTPEQALPEVAPA